mmetsp:Transcript_27898/g.78935  ORF Transcript_27898/g.78935 Transcript_27898/m.78935 type:complete len:118 (-) Transcript_27898:52-405(-)
MEPAAHGSWADPDPGTSRVLVALSDALHSLSGDGLLSSGDAESVWHHAHAMLGKEAAQASSVHHVSGRVNCYRCQRGSWMVALDRAALHSGPRESGPRENAGRPIGSLKVMGKQLNV